MFIFDNKNAFMFPLGLVFEKIELSARARALKLTLWVTGGVPPGEKTAILREFEKILYIKS